MEPNPFYSTPIPSQSAPEMIYNKIRDMITSGRLKPGDTIPTEGELIKMFQRSRPTVREAMRMLENDGLIKLNPGNKDSVVTEPSVGAISKPVASLAAIKGVTLLDLLEYREVNDIMILTLAAGRRTETDLENMREALSALRASLNDSDLFQSFCLEFLYRLADCTHNEYIKLMDQITKQLAPGVLSRGLSEEGPSFAENLTEFYEKIYRLIAEGNGQAAAELQLEHLAHIRANETASGPAILGLI